MKLIKLEITEFGGLAGRTIELGEGLNILEGQNESGKSTVLAFIRFMLYGLGGRLGSAEPSDKERYPGWSSGRAAGSMTLSTADGRLLRIEREGAVTHTARGDSYSEKPVRILDAETGELLHRGQVPGELLLGITAATFGSTCCVAQLKTTELNAGELSNGIENMLRAADESISVPRVCKRLEDARRELIHKNGRGGRIYDLKCECSRLEEQLGRAEDNAHALIELEAQLDECRSRTARAAAESAQLDELWERSEAWLTLGRFEQREAEAARLDELRGQLRALEADSFGGVVPPDGLADRLSAEAERVAEAERALESARLRCEQHAALPTYDRSLAERGQALEATGQSRSGLLDGYLKRRRAAARRRTFGTLALVCGTVCAAGGAALWLIAEQLIGGTVLLGAGLAACILGAALLSTVRRATRGVVEYVTSLGFDADAGTGSSAGGDPGAERLGRYIDDCRAAVQACETHMSAARALDQVRMNCLAALKREIDTAEELLEPLKAGKNANSTLGRAEFDQNKPLNDEKNADPTHGRVEPDRTPPSGSVAEARTMAERTVSALHTAAAECRGFARRRGELTREIAASEGTLGRLERSLEGCDRQFLQQRASRLARESAIGDEEHRRRREECSRVLREAYDEQTALERRIAFAQAQELSPSRVSAQLEAARGELERLTAKADAMTLALESIASASGQLRRGFTPALRDEAQRLLSVLTDGAHTELGISEDFALSSARDGATRSAALLSGGTRDAIYLSVRLALTRLLCRDELPPLLLDEALSQLDDARAARMLELLGAWCRAGGQCLLFTCHGREGRLAAGDEMLRVSSLDK